MSKKNKEESFEELSDEAKTAHEEQKVLDEAKESAEPDLDKAEMEKIEAAEKELDNSKLSGEELIEKYRELTNNIMIVADKVRESTGKVSGILENRFRDAYNTLHNLKLNYGTDNKRDGYKVLIERKGVDAKGFLVINAGSREEADTMVSDIREAMLAICSGGNDKVLSVVSGLSENTRCGEILASTIGGFAIQRYDIYPEYKAKKELYPLDNIPNQMPRENKENGSLVK